MRPSGLSRADALVLGVAWGDRLRGGDSRYDASMVSLSTHRDFRGVRRLPFCYVCGKDFVPGDSTNHDHVPAGKTFHVRDREPPLCLPTHTKCNDDHHKIDQKVTQLIGVRWGKPLSGRDRQLDIRVLAPGVGAVMNLNVDYAVMRWVRAFHSALYREALLLWSFEYNLVTPFPLAKRTQVTAINPILPQHEAFVQTIKEQRAIRNLDSIKSNNDKLTYECVWTQTDGGEMWLCVFALDLYDWKSLGRTAGQPLGDAPGTTDARAVLPRRPPPESGGCRS